VKIYAKFCRNREIPKFCQSNRRQVLRSAISWTEGRAYGKTLNHEDVLVSGFRNTAEYMKESRKK
jgi:hypothetical protein